MFLLYICLKQAPSLLPLPPNYVTNRDEWPSTQQSARLCSTHHQLGLINTMRHVSVQSPFRLCSVRMAHTSVKADSHYASRFRSVTVPSEWHTPSVRADSH